MDTTEHEGAVEENKEIGRFRTELGYEVVLTSVPRLGNGVLMTVFMMKDKEPVKFELYLDNNILADLSGAFLGVNMTNAFKPLIDSINKMHEREEDDVRE